MLRRSSINSCDFYHGISLPLSACQTFCEILWWRVAFVSVRLPRMRQIEMIRTSTKAIKQSTLCWLYWTQWSKLFIVFSHISSLDAQLSAEEESRARLLCEHIDPKSWYDASMHRRKMKLIAYYDRWRIFNQFQTLFSECEKVRSCNVFVVNDENFSSISQRVFHSNPHKRRNETCLKKSWKKTYNEMVLQSELCCRQWKPFQSFLSFRWNVIFLIALGSWMGSFFLEDE